ncbi:hypothetical protein PILCRDRAFT_86440 [Piloderma croceum F 1598]|uniref:Fungal-type protein kinase domain-containing protein n=1 Tax=Piloderma croceum (strain F 1598) TaxID=765440 RepID=A0A0C3G4Q6_PILCF|nr:hypothetical protein PILCRDRAFT_86440 [Piloderma croceum F 1598]
MLHAKDNDINLLLWTLIDHLGNQCEKRVLRLMVMEELFAITEWTNSHDLAETTCFAFDAFWQLVLNFVAVLKIMHCDISINNLMLHKEDNRVYGVLNDFDLTINVDSKSLSSQQRTSTKPFMALDLHGPNPLVHMCHHDLKSLFYVLIWITSRFHDGEEVADPLLQPWEIQSDPSLLRTKSHFIAVSELPLQTKEFRPHAECLNALQTMFSDGFVARRKIVNACSAELTHSQSFDFDDKTLGGFVTFDKFQEIINTL